MNARSSLAGPLVVAALWLAAGVPAAIAISSPRIARLGNPGGGIERGQTVLLEPGVWVGKRFPLLEYINAEEPLTAGTWFVVLYRPGCESCERAILDCEDLARSRVRDRWAPDLRWLRSHPTPPIRQSRGRPLHRGYRAA